MEKMKARTAINAVLDGFCDEELEALACEPDEFKRLARRLTRARGFFSAVPDGDEPKEFGEMVAKWRKFAEELCYDGPVLWGVKTGFTLKKHAPVVGPCHENYAYLQEWELENDTPTPNALVFCVPRVVAMGGSANEQKYALSQLRAKYALPEYHLKSFGSAALLSGLILEHFSRTGERLLPHDWIRTDTMRKDGRRLRLGNFRDSGLYCDFEHGGEDYLGRNQVFPVGLEIGYHL